MEQSITIKDNLKYLVIETGYVDRLLDSADTIEEEIKSRLDHECDCGDECEHCKNRIVFIGKTVFNDYSKDASLIKRELPDSVKRSIAVKCKSMIHAMDIVTVLMNQDYCGCFCWNNLYKMTINVLSGNGAIIHYTFDCESG